MATVSKTHLSQHTIRCLDSGVVVQLFCMFLTAVSLLTPLRLSHAEERPYRIVCTTGMIGDIVQHVAGSHAEVTTLISSGIDPHLYKPTRRDIASLLRADVIFYNGLFLEGKMTDALQRAKASGKQVYALAEHIDPSLRIETEEFSGNYDPHVWMDPLAWAEIVKITRNKLSEYDPSATEDYHANAERFHEKLLSLHRYAKRSIDSIPENGRILVTAHDAFAYFGRRYGLEVLGIQGLSTESEAGVQDIERLVAVLVQRKISAVFVESTVSARNIKALIEGAAAQGHEVRIGGSLYSDAMGPPSHYEGTYVGMIDHNVSTITRGLGGTAPRKGMQGLLSTNDTE